MSNLLAIRLSEIQDGLLRTQAQLIELRALIASLNLPDWPDDLPKRRLTGWKFVRGSHSGTYQRDPLGTDPLPANYDFHTHPPRYDKREPADADVPMPNLRSVE